MKPDDSGFRFVLIVAATALVLSFAYVEYRSRNPEWQTFQKRGIALTIQRLEKDLAVATERDKKREILSQIELLRNKQPEIFQISPFGGKLGPERCMTCHFGIEDVSGSHPNSVFGCVTGLGTCHSEREHPLLNRVENVPRSLMATNAGIISILRFQWGVESDSDPRFAIGSISDDETSLKALPTEVDQHGNLILSESHFRKFCAACHLWGSRYREKMGRMEGCPACHAPYGEEGRYVGCDPTVKRDEVGHSATHALTNRIPDDRCRACHNRSARVGLNYHGQMESTQYGTPFVRGGLNYETLSDDRFVWKLVPDIHHEKTMACIDCHTGQDAMGDGKVYAHMEDQIEVRCEDCHGSYSTPPKTMTVAGNDP